MVYFTREYQTFFQELSKNNSKTWFDSNRKRYEEHVKQPFAAFVEVMIGLIKADDPESCNNGERRHLPHQSRYPILKRKVSVQNPHGGQSCRRKVESLKNGLGSTFSSRPIELPLGAAAYLTEPPALYKIRKAIIKDLPSFKKLVTAKAFTSKYGSLQGERNKILPPEFKQWVAKEPLVANKQFYFMADLDAGVLLEKTLPDRLMSYYRAGSDINSFLKRAMTSK